MMRFRGTTDKAGYFDDEPIDKNVMSNFERTTEKIADAAASADVAASELKKALDTGDNFPYVGKNGLELLQEKLRSISDELRDIQRLRNS